LQKQDKANDRQVLEEAYKGEQANTKGVVEDSRRLAEAEH